MLHISRHARIRDAAAHGAHELLSGDLERSLPWLEAEEGRISADHHYIAVGRPGARAEALAVCYSIPQASAHRAYASAEVLLGRPTDALIHGLPSEVESMRAQETLARLRRRLPTTATDTLAVVAPGSVHSGVVSNSQFSPARRRAVLTSLVDAVEHSAAELGLPVVEFGHVRDDPSDRELHHVLRSKGYTGVTVGADAVLDVRFRDLDEYFTSFRSNRRKVLRKERQRFLATGPTISLRGADGLTDDLVDLQLARYLHYGHQADAQSVRDRFVRAAKIPGLKVLRADSDSGPLGFVAFYEDRARARIVPRLGAFVRNESACYFNLAYYELIAHAARLGGMHIHYGDSTYEAKTARGCALTRLTTYFRSPDTNLQKLLHEAGRLRSELEEKATQLGARTDT
ncbi:hypothetical protein [Streptomyces sioyaensis]|uniref:hypothetical protein n=1 Tax=Streptomyces sioyaensis TaxID=67364 RepID=UPI0037BD8191